MLESSLGLLVVVPLIFYSLKIYRCWIFLLRILIFGARDHHLQQDLDNLGAIRCHFQSGLNRSTNSSCRPRFNKNKRELYPKRGDRKIFAAYRNSGSNIRKSLQPHALFSKERAATHSSICVYTGVNPSGESQDATSTTRTAIELMDPPIEIRSAVLREVLGDRTVHAHVVQKNHSSLESARVIPRYTFCCGEFIMACVRQSIQENEGIELGEQTGYEWRHYCCFGPALTYGHDRPDIQSMLQATWALHKRMRGDDPTLLPPEELLMGVDPDAFDARLSVLGICKQLRSEALTALYSSNFFSFNDSITFGAFLRHVGVEKASLIRKIELCLTFECDRINDYDLFEISGPQNIRSNWTVGGSAPGLRYENMWAALDGLTEITLWVFDKVPIARRPRSEWNKARETRLKRIRLWLRWVFGELRGLHHIRKAKVLVGWKFWHEGLAKMEQIHYEADKEILQSVGDEFANEILASTPDRFSA